MNVLIYGLWSCGVVYMRMCGYMKLWSCGVVYMWSCICVKLYMY